MEHPFDLDRFIRNFCDPNIQPFDIYSKLNQQNQRTINIDVARTKSSILTPEEKQDLEVMLSYYCETNCHTYKQGMNEILVPFLLLSRLGVPRHIVYTCFSKFIEKFIETLFRDDYFRPLTGLFYITRLVLLYHYPEIQKCFDRNNITPDIYMTSWFVTMFAGKIKSLPLLYTLWGKLAECGNIKYLSYFGVAFLGEYRSLILEHDELTFPNVFKEMTIDDPSILARLIEKANELKENMPYTSDWVFNKYNLFNLEKTETFSNIIEKWPCVLVLPSCIIGALYHSSIKCECGYNSPCELMSHKYLLIDCRPSNEIKKGYFSECKSLSKGAQKSPEKLLMFPDKLKNFKSTHHIVLMGSSGIEEENSYFTRLVKALHDQEFKYISCVEGGYTACHQYAIENKIKFVHKEKECKVCLVKSGNKAGNIEFTLDRFFRLDTTRKIDLEIEKVYRCKVAEEEDIELSGIGLVVTSNIIAVVDKNSSEITEELCIEKLTKITCNKNKAEVLSFSFKENLKRVWILDSSEVKEFLTKVRANYSELKKIKNTIKQII